MKWIGGSLKQASADARAQAEIPTSLGVIDQKTIWEIYGVDIFWASSGLMNGVNGSFTVAAVLSAVADDTNYGDATELIRWTRYRLLYSGGTSPTISKTAENYDPISHEELIIPYQYANAKLFLTLSSSGTGAVQEIRYKLYYEEKKVSEVDFWKLQSLGCVC